MASLMRSRAALLIKTALPARVRAEDNRAGRAALLALVLLDGLFLSDDRRPHRVVDDLGLLLDLRAAVGADVDVRCLRLRRGHAVFPGDLGALLDDLSLFHANLH